MPFAELPPFFAELRGRDGSAVRALEFLLLTAARTAEVINAKWPEIDFAAREWVVPASRMKSGKAHRVPLGPAALRVLQAMEPLRSPGDYVFSGTRPGHPQWHDAMLRILTGNLGRTGLSVHGFSACFRTWVAEATTFPGDIAEAALAHIVGTKTELAYRRGDLFAKRRTLMDAWAAFLCGEAADTVVPFPAQR